MDVNAWAALDEWRNQLKLRQFAGMLIPFAGLMFYTGQSFAATWQQALSARATTEYETNPALSSTNQSRTRRFLIEPDYTLARADGVDELKAGLALQIVRSSNQAVSLNREDPRAFLNWSHQSNVGEFGISARYEEMATRATEMDSTGLTTVDGTRTTRTTAASWSKALSERSTLSADGAYSSVFYKNGANVDYVTRSGGLKLSHEISEGVVPFINMSYVDQKLAGSVSSSRRVNAILGLNWKTTERLNLTTYAGRSRSNTASSGSTNQYGLAAQYVGQLTGFSIKADRQTSPSGLGGFITSDQISSSLSHDFSERNKAGIDMGWRKNRSITNDINRNMDAWFQHDLSAFWHIRAHCLRRIREAGIVGRASSNLIGITLTYRNSGL